MAEFLIKAVSVPETTLSDYRDIINNRWVPEAQAFPYNKDDLLEAIADGRRFRDYGWAKRAQNPTSEQQQIIINYEANPLSDGGILELKIIQSHKNKIYHNHKVLTIEKFRTDADITNWLAKRHKSGNSLRGDFITIQENSWSWGLEEHPLTATRFNPPRFFILKIPSVTKEQAIKYIEPETTKVLDGDGILATVVETFRRWQLLISNLPQAIKDQIRDNGEITVTLAQIKPYIFDKVTGQTEG